MDEQQRQLIETDIDNTYLVEAGAGTGKTTLLVNRILYIIQSGKASLAQIVAITFTEKAAAELQQRLKEKLRQQQSCPVIAQYYRQALADIERAPITTIHGFCATLLREHPVEAQVTPDFAVASATVSNILYQETWQQWLSGQIAANQSLLKELLRTGITFRQMQEMAGLLAMYRDVLPEISLPQPLDIAVFRQTVTDAISELQRLANDCQERQDHGYRRILALERDWRYLAGLDDQGLLRRLVQGIPIKVEGNKKNWRPAQSLSRVKQILSELQARFYDLSQAGCHNLTWQFIIWLRQFIISYQQRKQSENVLDFEDLLIHTRDMLRHDKEVRAEVQQRYRYLLVDEFQDTNAIQVEILFFIAEALALADDWQSVELQPGKLFVVGDPKQSIYRFRGADIEIYEEVKRKLGARCCLQVVRNFRCCPQIISWVNTAFAQLIQPPEHGHYQPEYFPLYPHRQQPAAIHSVLLAQPPPPAPGQRLPIAEIIDREAEAIAQMIDTMVQEHYPTAAADHCRPLGYGDIAILLRRFSYVEAFEKALTRRNLPYQVIGSKSYYSRIEIKSLVALLRALLEPYNFIAVVATLRSTIFTVADEDIFAHQHQYHSLDYRQEFGANGHVSQVFTLLHQLHRRITKLSVPRLLETIFEHTGMLLTFLTLPQGEQRVANLLKVLDLAHNFARLGISDFHSFVARVDELEKSESAEAETMVAERRTEAVQILSIHRAKGLEFPAVFLGDLAGKSARVAEIIVNRTSGTPAVRLRGRVTLKTSDYAAEAEMEKQRLEAEEIRLLYVAATRARDYLVIPLVAGNYGYLKLLAPFLDPSRFDQSAPQVVPVQIDVKSKAPLETSLPRQETTSADTGWQQQRSQWLEQRHSLLSQAAASSEHSLSMNDMVPICAPALTQSEVRLGEAILRVLAVVEPLASDDIFLAYELEPLLVSTGWELALSVFENKIARQVLGQAVNSSLLLRAQHSRYYLRQLPFSLPVNNGNLQGIIDLCFQERKQFVLVIYEIQDRSRSWRQENLENYQRRAGLYALAFQEASGLAVKEVIFYFLRPNVWQQFVVTPTLLGQARTQLQEGAI